MNALLNLLCPPAWAHPGEIVSLELSAALWWQWRMEWVLLCLLLFIGGLYFRFLKQTAVAEKQNWEWKSPLLFWGGLASIYVAAASPIDRIGEEYLFSVHMVQHNLFTYVTAWLLLAGTPSWLLQAVLNRLGRFAKETYRYLRHPITACLLFNLTFTLWHIPFLYDWALQDRMVHNLEHLSMILTSLVLWLPLWGPIHEQRPIPPLQLLYLVSVAIGQLPVFAYVTFSKQILYPTYALAPRLTSLSPLADQQLGGVIMKIVGMLVMFAGFAGVFLHWYKTEREKDEHEERVRLAQQRPSAAQT